MLFASFFRPWPGARGIFRFAAIPVRASQNENGRQSGIATRQPADWDPAKRNYFRENSLDRCLLSEC
jgi:hypothetical protein